MARRSRGPASHRGAGQHLCADLHAVEPRHPAPGHRDVPGLDPLDQARARIRARGRRVKVLSPRSGYFDSWLVEAGPPALLTAHGILLLYNAGNSGEFGDPTLPARVYTGGQALYDSRNPLKLIARSDAPFLRPTEDYERNGQYPAGTTFVEGLVPFHGRWYLYYGTADSRVGVAVGGPSRPTR